MRAYAYERPLDGRPSVQVSVLQLQSHTNLLTRFNELFSAKTLTHARFLKIFTRHYLSAYSEPPQTLGYDQIHLFRLIKFLQVPRTVPEAHIIPQCS